MSRRKIRDKPKGVTDSHSQYQQAKQKKNKLPIVLLSDKFNRQINYCDWEVHAFHKTTEEVMHFSCRVVGKLANDIRYARPQIKKRFLSEEYEILDMNILLQGKIGKEFTLKNLFN